MAKNFDDYGDDEDIPIKPVEGAQVRSLDGPDPLLVLTVQYWDSAENEAKGETSSINLIIDADAAELLGAALIDSAKKRRVESGVQRIH